MSKTVRKTIAIPDVMAQYAKELSIFLKVSENDVYKMILFDYMNKHKRG